MRRTTLLCALCAVLAGAGAASARSLAELHAIQTASVEPSCAPFEVHLAIGDDQQSLRVAWRTQAADCPSIVYYRRALNVKETSTLLEDDAPEVQGVGHQYSLTEGQMCTAPATRKKFTVNMHVAFMRDLEPYTRYWYSMAGSDQGYEVMSPPKVGSTQPFSFVAYGDMGESKHNKKHCAMAERTVSTVLDQMDTSPFDLVVHVGDLAYADGKHKVWDSFMESIEPIASRVPYMVGVGNHEYDFVGSAAMDPSGVREPYRPVWGNMGDDSGGECGAMTARRFIMPNVRAATDNAPFWYSFDYASVHFTMLSTEHDMSPGSVQYNWLARDLASVDRCVTPWVVVSLHRPMYVVYPHKSNMIVGDHIRDFIEDLLLEYKVDLTLAGHVHTYYRTCDVRDERCTEDGSGIYHFVVGTAGHVLSETEEEQRDWLDAHVGEHGFMRFDVEQDSMMARFIRSSDGSVRDQVRLVTRLYHPDACGALRAEAPARMAKLDERLRVLTAEHTLKAAQEKLRAAEQLRVELTGEGGEQH